MGLKKFCLQKMCQQNVNGIEISKGYAVNQQHICSSRTKSIFQNHEIFYAN